ncbi:MAG TPA: helix-turn-helix transcriptional regulator [Candidatus Elarobacter sp.]|jgi:DNA-binding CsgD family transcriptional regulator|nr:helix-turn-helix transcriptional regulator [Candidatus Elarobacter sp.]
METNAARTTAARAGAPPLREARDAWSAGEWQRAIDLLTAAEIEDRSERVAAAFLIARAALSGAQAARALVALDDVAELPEGPDERVIAGVLRGGALVRLGRLDEALPLLERAAAEAAVAGAGVRAEAGYELALAYFTARRFDEAEAALDAHADPQAGIVHARALELFGWIEVRRERYPIAARHFLEALDALRGAAHRDALMHASLLHGMTSIAQYTLDLKLFERVRHEVDALAWSPAIAARWFAIRRSRAFVELLEGNAEEAWRIADETLAQSAPGAQRVGALVTLARVARASGDAFTPDQLVRKAGAIAAEVDWGATAADDRTALLAVARDAAEIETADAERLVQLYRALPPPRAPHDALELDPRLDALEDLAQAALARARGETPEAVARLRAATGVWRATGDRYDEAVALLALIEAASDEESLARADELTRVAPRSWLRRRYAALAERARGVEQLSPAEHRVMLAICEGRSTAEIAERFGRSKNTIRNQTRRVYEVMDVRTRSALVSKCAALGIVGAAAS